MPNADQTPRLTDLLPDAEAPGFGSAMVRLAQMAAAMHRADCADGDDAASSARPWTGLSVMQFSDQFSDQDEAEHGCSAVTRSPRACGAVTTEGDR